MRPRAPPPQLTRQVRRKLRRWDVRRLLPIADRSKLAAEANRLLAYTESFPFRLIEHAKRKDELHARFDARLKRALAARGYTDAGNEQCNFFHRPTVLKNTL